MLPVGRRIYPAWLQLTMSLFVAGVLEHVLRTVAVWKQSGWHYLNRDLEGEGRMNLVAVAQTDNFFNPT